MPDRPTERGEELQGRLQQPVRLRQREPPPLALVLPRGPFPQAGDREGEEAGRGLLGGRQRGVSGALLRFPGEQTKEDFSLQPILK